MQNKDTSIHNLTAFLPAFREALSKHLPEFRVMHQCWNRAIGISMKGKIEKSDSEDELKINERKFQVAYTSKSWHKLNSYCIKFLQFSNFISLGFLCHFIRENFLNFTNVHYNVLPFVGELQVPKTDHLLKVVQNICLYQSVLPDVLSEQAIDFPGLLGNRIG